MEKFIFTIFFPQAVAMVNTLKSDGCHSNKKGSSIFNFKFVHTNSYHKEKKTVFEIRSQLFEVDFKFRSGAKGNILVLFPLVSIYILKKKQYYQSSIIFPSIYLYNKEKTCFAVRLSVCQQSYFLKSIIVTKKILSELSLKNSKEGNWKDNTWIRQKNYFKNEEIHFLQFLSGGCHGNHAEEVVEFDSSYS